LLDVQREQTLGKIQKAHKELLLGKATTGTKKKREEEDTSGGGENPFARGNKKAKKGGKRVKNSR
tara:strand:- start:1202 stop:1396 length:195 start_codon:yes stop_codon:yes gene_type:complete